MIKLIPFDLMKDSEQCELCPYLKGCEASPTQPHPSCHGGYFRVVKEEIKEEMKDNSKIVLIHYIDLKDDDECDLCPYIKECGGSKPNTYGCRGGYFRIIPDEVKYYEWDEPWNGLTKEEKPVFCNVRIRMSEEAIINHMRFFLQENGFNASDMTDQELLDEFITINWAWEAK